MTLRRSEGNTNSPTRVPHPPFRPLKRELDWGYQQTILGAVLPRRILAFIRVSPKKSAVKQLTLTIFDESFRRREKGKPSPWFNSFRGCGDRPKLIKWGRKGSKCWRLTSTLQEESRGGLPLTAFLHYCFYRTWKPSVHCWGRKEVVR